MVTVDAGSASAAVRKSVRWSDAASLLPRTADDLQGVTEVVIPADTDVILDMFLHSRFATGDIAKERAVIKEERASYRDQPQHLVQELLNETLWPGHPLGRAIEGIPPATVPNNYYAIGHYYTLTGKTPFNHLVYPVARQDWLGVHVTVDLGGRCKFGPDFSWRDSLDYKFDESREPLFYEAIRRYFPGLKDGTLQPGYTGMRPRITGKGQEAVDFMIHGPRDHGVPGLVNLYGIESPGLTSSMAIAAHVGYAPHHFHRLFKR